MRYLVMLLITLAISILLNLMGARNWSLKVSGGFFVINAILLVLGLIKANELLIQYLK